MVPNIGAPFFTNLPKNIKISVGEMIPITFSKINDPDKEDTGSIHLIDFGQANSFIVGSYPSYLINPSSNETDPGVY